MKLYKYTFKSKKAFKTQLNKLDDNVVNDIIFLEDVNNFCVDIVWKKDIESKNFSKFKVNPKTPNHKIYGW